MTFDNEEHKQVVLNLINQATFKGEFLEKVVELKAAIEQAEIKEQK
jgi:hypothetical protein